MTPLLQLGERLSERLLALNWLPLAADLFIAIKTTGRNRQSCKRQRLLLFVIAASSDRSSGVYLPQRRREQFLLDGLSPGHLASEHFLPPSFCVGIRTTRVYELC